MTRQRTGYRGRRASVAFRKNFLRHPAKVGSALRRRSPESCMFVDFPVDIGDDLRTLMQSSPGMRGSVAICKR